MSLTASGEQLEITCHEALKSAATMMSDVTLDDTGSQYTVGQLTKMLGALTTKEEPEESEKS